MKPQWHFNARRACDRMRDSANDAFFTAESLETLSEALIREAIQNSLDAAQRDGIGSRQIRVRIAFQPKAAATAREFLVGQFASVRENFARGIGVASVDAWLADCGYVVIEDFGTRGLTGDVNEYRLEYAEKNAFFSFFRAEGRSAKTGESLGRWGIGKQLFPTASRLHAMFGVTVRADAPNRVLMGSAVVRNHSVGGKDFQPDAWFGCREQDDNPVQPVTSAEFIDSFSSAFGLQRTNQTGLSVVVPSVDERVNTDDIRRGIVPRGQDRGLMAVLAQAGDLAEPQPALEESDLSATAPSAGGARSWCVTPRTPVPDCHRSFVAHSKMPLCTNAGMANNTPARGSALAEPNKGGASSSSPKRAMNRSTCRSEGSVSKVPGGVGSDADEEKADSFGSPHYRYELRKMAGILRIRRVYVRSFGINSKVFRKLIRRRTAATHATGAQQGCDELGSESLAKNRFEGSRRNIELLSHPQRNGVLRVKVQA